MIHINCKILLCKYFLVFRVLFIMLFCSLSFSQTTDEKSDKRLSNQFVYEGNIAVKENFYEAERKYRTALSKNKLNSKGAYNLSHAYYNAELYDEAQARLIEATKNGNKKEKHQAFHNLGNIFMKENACKKAVEAYKNALRNNPKDDETRYNLAIAKECAKEEEGGGGNDEEKKDNEKQEDKKIKKTRKTRKIKKTRKTRKAKTTKKEQEDKKDSKKNENEPKEKTNPENQQGKLSPQQIKNLLEAMNNEENKVQEKMNASKQKELK